MNKVYLLVVHDYDGYKVLHVFSDSADANEKMQEYIRTMRDKVLANPNSYVADPNCTFNYEVLEFPLE